MAKTLSRFLVASAAALALSSAYAVPYSYTGADVGGFALLGASPTSSVDFYSGKFNSATGKYEFVASINAPAQLAVGATGAKDLSAYDGVTMSLTNSSFQTISSSLFVATQGVGGYNVYVGDTVSLTDNASANLNLDFGNAHLYTTDSQFSIISDQGTGHALTAVNSVVAYGFGIGSTTDGYIHGAASVPEPGTLALFGIGLLGLAATVGVRRKQAA